MPSSRQRASSWWISSPVSAPQLCQTDLYFAIGERVFGVKLQLVDFEIGEVFGEVEQRFQFRHAAARNVEHHAAARKIRPVADFQAGQAAAVLAQQLPQRRRGRAQAAGFAKCNLQLRFAKSSARSLRDDSARSCCWSDFDWRRSGFCFGSVNVPGSSFSERGQGSKAGGFTIR